MKQATFTHNGETYIAYAHEMADHLQKIETKDGESISFLDCSLELIEKARKAVCLV